MATFFSWLGQLPAPLYWVVVLALAIVALPIFWFLFGVVMVVMDGGNGPDGGGDSCSSTVLAFMGLGAIGSFCLLFFFAPSLLYLLLGFGPASYFLGVLTSIVLSFGAYFGVAYRDYKRARKQKTLRDSERVTESTPVEPQTLQSNESDAQSAATEPPYNDSWLRLQGETALALEIDWGLVAPSSSRFPFKRDTSTKGVRITHRDGIHAMLGFLGDTTPFESQDNISQDEVRGSTLAYLDIEREENEFVQIEVSLRGSGCLVFRYNDKMVALAPHEFGVRLAEAVTVAWDKAQRAETGYVLY